jgi:predicted CoA-binding protein
MMVWTGSTVMVGIPVNVATDERLDRRWCQFGVINQEGARIAETGGVAVIMDRCLKVERARYSGRMHWFGLNTGRITSVRTGLQ